MTLLAWLFGLIVLIVAIAVAVAFLSRFYRKTSRDVAIIRTGFGGQKIVLSGGCLALPFLHKVDEINMRTMRIEVVRAGPKSLITEDRMRVDVELEFYLRVQPTIDGVATAAQAIGSKSLSPDGVRNLLEGRFIDAIQATAASLTMDSLHDRRAEFVRTIRESVRENLAHSGLQLESVSLTRMDQAAFASLDDNNAFNAVGLRKLAEIIATSKKKRAEIEADADVSVRQTQLEAIKQRLTLSRQEEEAQIAQRLEIEKLKASSDADTARAREQSMVASESARIDREKDTRIAEIQKARELRRLKTIPFAAYCSDPCDGRTQGTTGMFDSLPYRNDAAITMRRLIRSLPRRAGVIGIATCDKGLPATMLALAGCGHLPGIIVPGGVTLPAIDGEDAGKVQTIGARFAVSKKELTRLVIQTETKM